MSKVITVNKAAKDQGQCGRCQEPLPKGSGYRHTTPGFRGRKIVRCLKPGCYFRQSEMTTSKMSEVYAAQEDADADIDAAESVEDLRSAAEACANRIREVAQEYADAAEAMGGAGEEMAEKADLLESAADEIEGFEPEATSVECHMCNALDDPNPECEQCGGAGEIDDVDMDDAKDTLRSLIDESVSI